MTISHFPRDPLGGVGKGKWIGGNGNSENQPVF